MTMLVVVHWWLFVQLRFVSGLKKMSPSMFMLMDVEFFET